VRPPAQTEPAPGTIITTGAAKFLAVFRVVLGFEFLWAFADNTFGFGYAKFTSAGEPSMSTNPIVDYHLIYALFATGCVAGGTGSSPTPTRRSPARSP
jgi:hypothetical protein